MTNDPPILRNSLIATPITVGLASSFGVDHAVAAGVSSALVLVNFWVLSVLGPPIVRALARGESPALWVAALLAKFALFFGAYYLLFQILPPFGLGLGFVSLLIGTLLTGIQLARQDASTVREA